MSLRFQKGDVVAIGLVVALAILVALLFLPQRSQSAGLVQIYHQGELIRTLPLDQPGQFTVTGDYTNVITVADGRVCISASDCPGEDCVHSGAISTAGRSLVCLPNGLEVRVVGKPDDVDFVVR